MGGAQVWALSVIHAAPGIGVSELARTMDIHQTTASNLVKTLARNGLASAERNGPDRRTVQLRILPAGIAVMRKASGPFAGVLPEALNQLDLATLLQLERDLSQLIAVLHADEASAGIPLAPL